MTQQPMDRERAAFVLPAMLPGREAIERLKARLERDGIVLVEGLDPRVEVFEAFTEALGETFVLHPEVRRDSLGKDGTTQSVTYGNEAIPLHAERAFLPNRPKTLYFMCVVPPSEGGETLVCDGAELIDRLPGDLARFVSAHQVRYDYLARAELWQRTFQTTDRDAAAEKLTLLAGTLGPEEVFSYRFEGDALASTYIVPLAATPRYGRRRAFASSFFYLAPLRRPELWEAYLEDALRENPTSPGQIRRMVMEDGRPFPREVAEGLHRVARELTVAMKWRAGDLAIIDNTRFMHGRNAFRDGERRILVRMSTVGVKL
jgi:hypothetical protein